MVGIVAVSHSRALATAAVELASEMVPAETRPPIAVAAGLDDTTFGTDAAAIASAIQEVDSPDGVLVLLDLGSAILSAEMACEFIDPDLVQRVKISPAPLVEGLVAAVVTASTGGSLADVAAEAEAGLVAKRDQLGAPDSGDQGKVPVTPPIDIHAADALRFTTTIRNPHGLHARPAAALVTGLRGIDAQVLVSNATTGKGPVTASSVTMVQTLGLRKGDMLTAQIIGPQAEQAKERLESLAASEFGEKDAGAPVGAASSASPTSVPAQDPSRTGRQIAIGVAHRVSTHVDTSSYKPSSPDEELARLDQAYSIAGAAIDSVGKDSGTGIHEVQRLMLDDEATLDELKKAIAAGTPATEAVNHEYALLADQLEAVGDPYFTARAEDQRGLSRILQKALMGQDPTPPVMSGVVILDELDPLTASSLDPSLCDGVITTSGGATGHGVILAQAKGIALLTGRTDAATVTDGQTVAFDPVTGELWINPTADELTAIRARQSEREAKTHEALIRCHEPAMTSDGRRVLVEANISSVDDARTALTMGADGSGLVRTEILFSAYDHAPTAEEQAEAFIQIGHGLGDQQITVRTWDPGGDKPLSFLPQDKETNPMLGERGIRAMKRLPELFDTQVTAILLASKQVPIRVMFPMITVPEEIAWARARLDALQAKVGATLTVGMMVETPSAAARAADYVGLVDFISIGTNDLTQYTMAADRGNALVTALTRGPIDAVWSLIGSAAAAFAGKPVAVCGDLASDPAHTARLVDLGVTELSVRAPVVGVVKQAVREIS